jgi:uncharacterized protein (TIGR03663 family)
MNRWGTTLVLLILAGAALALRWPALQQRPFHNDEAVNAVKFADLWENGAYRYDPHEYHGPTLHYATWALNKLIGPPPAPSPLDPALPALRPALPASRNSPPPSTINHPSRHSAAKADQPSATSNSQPSTLNSQLLQSTITYFPESRFRALPLLAGVGLILLLPFFRGDLGRYALLWAALFIAVSPAMVFYSTYFIHEMLLAFFTLLTLAAGWRYWSSLLPANQSIPGRDVSPRRPLDPINQSKLSTLNPQLSTPSIPYALLTGTALGAMHATKETFVITLGCIALALLLNDFWRRKLDAAHPPSTLPRVPWTHLAAALALWLFVAALFFTSFFANLGGLLDSVRTYQPWLQRAGGDSPHLHPWWFYLQRLAFFHVAKGPVWTEALILLLALYAIIAAFRRRGLPNANYALVRFLGLYTILLAAAYSVISYKTPWCLLSFWIGAILLAGAGAAGLIASLASNQSRLGLSCILLAGAVHLAVLSWQTQITFATDRRNPYVYAQTSPDLRNLLARIEKFAAASPRGHGLLMKVIAADGDYWPLPWYLRAFPNTGWYDALPPEPYADVMVVSAKLHADLDARETHLMIGFFQLRPEIFLECYVEKNLWIRFLAQNPPQPDPE